jgi:S-phase kinase-associated protein 1
MSNQIKLQSSDEQTFTVEKQIAERSVLLKNMLEDIAETTAETAAIPLANVTGKVLKKVIEYCTHHKEDPIPTVEDDKDAFEQRKRLDDVSEWDAAFVKVDNEHLFEIILAANYLDIKPLLDLGYVDKIRSDC